MNIQEAKTEICNTLRAYLAKDENGYYTYPLIRQRPLLLIGPPGIGKTAIMEQAAAECGVGLVAYTITHHTRQSAIGLPEIVKRNYGGKGMMVTDYTMSEIVASVYDCMENTGRKEGILFIDAIISYLSVKKNNFYAVENTVDGKFFVTARGWEDLSRLLQSYEKLGIGISEELVEEFLQKEETARDFAGFYQLYTKYGEDYEIPSILSGNLSRENLALKEKMAADGAFEERFAVLNLILGALREKAEEYGQADHQLEVLYEMLLHLRTQVRKNAEEEKLGISLLEEFVQEQENSLQIKVKMELISVREQKYQETAIRRLREYILTAKKEHVRSAENGFKRISKCFEKEAVCREDVIQKLQGELQNAFSFIKESFGENQEMLLFVTGITADKSMTSFIAGNGCPAYFEHSEMLLYNKEENELRKACLEAVHERLQEESRDRV